MDANQRTQLICTAVTAVGPKTAYETPEAWQAALHATALDLAVMTSEGSDIANAVSALSEAKVFSGTVTGIYKEKSSTRGVITLHTGTDRVKDGVPAGCEQVRTDRTDGAVGRAMALSVKELIGHRLLVRVVVEEFNGGQGKVRVVKHITDLGVDPQFEQKTAPAA